jgi:predicted HicB family RNase H-like nuclease
MMDILKYKDYEGSAELEMSRNMCRGKILFIDDLVTYEAASPAELQKEFEAAVDDYLDTCKAVGKEPARPFRGLFNVRVSPALHRAAALRAAADGVSLNEVVLRALNAYVRPVAEVNQRMRIAVIPNTRPVNSFGTITSVAGEQPRWSPNHVH